MFRNYLTVALRNLSKNKIYATINIAGLAMGITAFLFILEYVSLEKSVNQFHAKLPNLARMMCQNAQGENWPQVEPGWAEVAKSRLPEIKSYCRFSDGITQGVVQNQLKNLSFREESLSYVEGNFFDFFSFPLVAGQAKDLNQPDAAFISASMAKKYFGEESPLEQTLKLNNQFGNHVYVVKGVYEDMKDNSDIRYDMVFSLETLKNKENLNGNFWADLSNLDNQYINMLFELSPNTNLKALEKKLTALRREIQSEKDATVFRLQPLAEVHLAKSAQDNLQHTGNYRYVLMLMGIAFLILLIAWFNYINLNTANSIKRANEVGVRKAIGASQQNLLGLFLVESVLVNLSAFVLAIVLVVLLQPLFNQLFEKTLSLQTLFLNPVWALGVGLLLLSSVVSGVYIALVLARFKPVDTLKGKLAKTSSGVFLRKSLVVIQFSISVALIISTMLVFKQLKFMQQANLGFDSKQLVLIPAPQLNLDETYKQRSAAYQDEIAQQSFVEGFCTSGSGPGRGYNFATDGFSSPKSKKGTETQSFAFAIIGENYLPTFKIPLKAGRNFTAIETDVEWNDNDKVILNEKAAKALGFEDVKDALTTKITWDERKLQVIGVVKDYHHEGLQKAIGPMIFYPAQVNDLTIKLSTDNLPAKLAKLEKIYKKYFVGNPFEYLFVDELFNKQYKVEAQFGKIFSAASILAILIACMGLFGLTVFTVESRTKEIGIRKVLGASVGSISSLLTKDFLKLVFVAIVIASPIAYYFMNQWLADFAYRTPVQWWVFALAGGLALLLALVTIGFQSVKAALANPVESLRSE
ncbi:ABC transporter permease [Haliscomenobacter sp.]|uniref:ABC transporter permease n=1 Tax=Haliscomenobacter sp. TaxID=2717303 RepID=UPI003BA92574